MYATLQGTGSAPALPVIAGTLTVPRAGAWRADLTVDAPSAAGLTGPVVLLLGDGASSWTGRAFRSADAFGRAEVRVVGGLAQLAQVLPGQSYRQVTASVVLRDILAGAGGGLDASADAGTLAQPLPAWTRPAGPASTQIAALAARLGVAWRILASGRLWLGPETWPVAAFDYDLLEKHPREGRWELGSTEGYKLLPGSLLAGQPVDVVEHAISAEELRTTVWFSP